MNETKEKLLNYAYELIRQKGINAMSYKDLSDKIGISKASIHYHFPKKEDLISCILNQCKNDYTASHRKIIQTDGTIKERMLKLAQASKEGIEVNQICFMGILSAEKDSLSPKTLEQLQIAIKETASALEQIFIEAQEKGLLKSKVNTYDAALTFLNLLMGGQLLGRALEDSESFMGSIQFFVDSVLQ